MPPVPSRAGGVPRLTASQLAIAPGVQLRSAWIAARARNALRRRFVIGGVSVVTFVATLLAFILVPRQAARLARLAAPRPGEKVDTAALVAEVSTARRTAATADSAVAAKRGLAMHARTELTRLRRAPVAIAPLPTARRDALAATIGDLDRLVARAQTSPLPASYRAVADAPPLRGDPRVRALVDSLDEVERERETFGVVGGGVDPIYVSLTARVTALGRAMIGIAEARRAQLRDEYAAAAAAAAAPPSAATAIMPTPVPAVPPPTLDSTGAPAVPAAPPLAPGVRDSLTRVLAAASDTTNEMATRINARLSVIDAERRLALARDRNAAVDARAARARARADVEAPPLAMVFSALALALACGFGAALAVELRRPRMADAREAERLTRARVLAIVRPEPAAADRARRGADEAVPAIIDPSLESYRLLYLSLSATGEAIPVVGLTGDEPPIYGAVAANLAAVAAEDGRSTLLIDADGRHPAASLIFGVGAQTGLGELLRGEASLAEVLVSVGIGRDLAVDVVPAGHDLRSARAGGREGEVDPRTLHAARAALVRLARRYDFVVVALSPDDAERGAESLLLAPDVVVCTRAAHTPLSRIARDITRLRSAGSRIHGLVVWADEVPVVAGETVEV